MDDPGDLSTLSAQETGAEGRRESFGEPAAEPAATPVAGETEQLADSGFFAAAPPERPPAEKPGDRGRSDIETRSPRSTPGARHRPGRIGRFVLLETIGAGAMGEVYEAYDSQLDRKVAIKLVHPDRRGGLQARRRLLREAQTLAQVSHPNVVQVYEAGEFDGRVFLVMEYVRGTTLTRWLASRDELPRARRRREIIRRFIAAGRGLQAAHDAGLAHRDFKPDNVLIGDDGRLRVVDFGLARVVSRALEDDATQDPELKDTVNLRPKKPGVQPGPAASPGLDDTVESGSDDLATSPGLEPPLSDITPGYQAAIALTATGSVLGTPRFMAPEQMRGEPADSRSDQFSLCVALFQALFGRFPYPGESFAELMDSVERGAIDPSFRREAPAGIARALARGLAVEPDERFGHIRELLDELERWLQQRQRRLAGLMVALAALGVAFGVIQQARQDSVPVCASAQRELATVWHAQRRSAVEQAILGIDHPYAREAWSRVATGLDRYSDQWAAMHREACLAHQQGEQSSVLLDTRMACLERRRDALDSALTVLADTDEQSLSSAVDVVQKLPRLDHCGDTQALMAEVPPPEDPAVRAQVDDLRARLGRVQALEHAGRFPEAAALARTLVVEAEELSYPPVHAEALLFEGRVRMNLFPRVEALAPLGRASYIGFRSGADVIALEAFARRVYMEAVTSSDPASLVPPDDMAEALAGRSRDRVFVHALLLNNVGVVHWARDDQERAR